MMRQNFTTHHLSCYRIKETSLGVAQSNETKLKTSFDEQAYTGTGRGKFVHHAAQFAKHFIPALMIALMLLVAPPPTQARISIGVTVGIAPPPLLVYEQPPCPGPNYIWTPGYWAWGPDGYFWVPGTWVLAPYPGELWTPGYWAWDLDGDAYIWHEGYWGPEVGFYGGINYGFGYFGGGYEGGYWRNHRFYYNRAANNIRTTNITTVYNRTVVNRTTTYVSYNGGRGGITARPTTTQLAAAHQRHDPPAPLQRTQLQAARWNRAQLATAKGGRPAVAATPRPGVFSGSRVVTASRFGGPVNTAKYRGTENQLPVRTERNGNKDAGPHLNPGRVAPQQRRGNQQVPPHNAGGSERIPHANGNPHAAAIRQTTSRQEGATRAAAQQRNMPGQRAATRGGSRHRSAPQPKMAQHHNPHPPHGGR